MSLKLRVIAQGILSFLARWLWPLQLLCPASFLLLQKCCLLENNELESS